MVEIRNENKYEIGNEVWWFDAWDNLRHGIIYDFRYRNEKDTVPFFACIHENGRVGSETGAKIENCWPSKEACLDAENRRMEAQKAEYMESIKDAKDLVKFLFEHDVRSDTRDYAAFYAAKTRANELFGEDLHLGEY